MEKFLLQEHLFCGIISSYKNLCSIVLRGGGYVRREVDVVALHQKNGNIIPQYILWDSERFYEVEEVTHISQPVSGNTIIFTCIVAGREAHLYLDKDTFYVETA